MQCPKCATNFPPTASFCPSCGWDLGTTTPLDAIPETQAARTALDIVRDALHADYDVKEEIGRGGMAMVFRGEERSLEREVAIKVLPFSQVHDANLVERFINEARTSASLEHPNIIPIYRVGQAGDVIYFAMRYLSGPTLSHLITELGPMDPRDIRRILIESARALGYAHQHGIVHRDIKPDNIMFRESGEVVVCDFGIAKAMTGTRLTETGKAIGTPYYMSPEQIRAQDLDGRSDIYSLGVVAYQCLTKQVPFDGDDSFAIGYKHITEALPTPAFRTSDHRKLFAIIRRMTAKDPAERFQTAAEVVEALTGEKGADAVPSASQALTAAARSAVSAPTRPAGPPVPTPATPEPVAAIDGVTTPRQPRRRRGRTLVGMGLLVGFGGMGGGGYYYSRVAPDDVPVFVEPVMPWVNAMADRVDRARGAIATRFAGTPPADTVAVPLVAVTPAPSDSTSDSLGATSDSTTTADSAAAAAPAPDPDPTPRTGWLVVAGLAPEASVWIDDRFVSGGRHELSPGLHRLRVAAPGTDPVTAEVTVVAGDTTVHRVRARTAAQCERLTAPGYNAGQACFDQSPALPDGTAALVPLTSEVTQRPTRPTMLAIFVRADGTAERVVVNSPSDVPAFTLAAVRYAHGLHYHPAQKNGRSVPGWLELTFYPGR